MELHEEAIIYLPTFKPEIQFTSNHESYVGRRQLANFRRRHYQKEDTQKGTDLKKVYLEAIKFFRPNQLVQRRKCLVFLPVLSGFNGCCDNGNHSRSFDHFRQL